MNGFFFYGSRRDEKGCKLTSAGVCYLSKFSPISVGCTSITEVPDWQSFCGLIVSSSPTRLHRLHNEILGHNGAANLAPHSVPLSFPFSSIILRWRVECSTAGSFLLLQGELRKQARASVMLLSLQGGEEMSCSTAKDDHLRACETRFPSGSHRDTESQGPG